MAHELDDITPLVWREAKRADLGELGDLLTAINYFDDPTQNYGIDEVIALWDADHSPYSRLVMGWEAQCAVAFVWNQRTDATDALEVRLAGGVHPAYRHQTIGRKAFAWQRDQALADHEQAGSGEPLRLVAYSDEKLAGKRETYALGGLEPGRWFLDMRASLTGDGTRLAELLAEPAPTGIRFVPWSPELCASCREAHNAAFEEEWNSDPIDADAWHAQVHRPAARLDWSWLAVDVDDRVVGYALNSEVTGDDGAEGWTDRLGVRPSHRGRGIATALLARSLDSFRRAGAESGGLGLDARGSDGLGLYRSVGYSASDVIIEYAAEGSALLAAGVAERDVRDDVQDNDEKGGDR